MSRLLILVGNGMSQFGMETSSTSRQGEDNDPYSIPDSQRSCEEEFFPDFTQGGDSI